MPGQQGEPVSRAQSLLLEVKGSRRRCLGGSGDGGEIRSRAARVCYCERFGGDRLETLLFAEKYYHTQLAYP